MHINYTPQRFILAVSALALLTPSVSAEILEQFTFGSVPPSILTPTTVGTGVSGGSIIGNSGLTLDLNSNQGNPPASSPWLRVSPKVGKASAAEAFTENATFEFTLSAIPGFTLNLTDIAFDAMKGGSGTRGYGLRTSVDNFGATISTADIPTARGGSPDFTKYSVPLSAANYQNLSTITFKFASYANGTNSVEYDNITVNGTSTFSGYTWQGGSSNWDTTSANWSGTGPTYVDNTAASNVLFSDAGATGAVNVAVGGLKPNLVTFTNSTAKDYTFANGSLTVATSLFKSGNGTATFNNSVSAGSVTADAGILAVGATGTLTSPNITVTPTGNLTVASGGSLGESSGLVVNGPVNLSNVTQKVATLNGAATGLIFLNDTVLEVKGTSTYAGQISGSGTLVKSNEGVLTLSGNNSHVSTSITGGAIQANHVNALGSKVSVNSGGTLSIGVNDISNEIILAGGTVGVSIGATVRSLVTVTAPTTINTFNPITGGTGNDLIFAGELQGSGDLEVVSINGTSPDNKAFRLQGFVSTGENAYSGTIKVNQSAKFELQTTTNSGSPMGTGKLVVAGGTNSGTAANGNFSIVNVRNNSGADTTLGNNVEVTGTGYSYFNMLGNSPVGSVTTFGELRIGGGQGIAAVASTGGPFTLAFSSVHLTTEGNANFTPRIVGNTAFPTNQNIELGAISAEFAGSGITMNGASTLTLTGNSTYTGPTIVESGTLVVNGSISGSAVTVHAGTLRGSGTTGPLTFLDGTLAPGDGIGVLNTGALTLGAEDAGGVNTIILSIEIGGAGVGAYDQLNVSGSPKFNAPVSLALDFSDFDPEDGADSFVILNNTSANAIFFADNSARFVFGSSLLSEGAIFTATSGDLTQDFQITYAGGVGGNDIVLTAVPEPSAAAALLMGLGVLASRRRRRG